MEGAAAGAPLALTAQDVQVLDRSRWWARFNAIVGFVGTGLIGLAVLLVVVLPTPIPAAIRALVGFGGLVGVGLMAAYFSILHRYASGIADNRRGDAAGATRAFRAMKVFWIVIVIIQILSVFFTLVLTLTQLAGIGPATTGAGP